MSERRYREEEIARIFEQAQNAESQLPAPAASGLTLSELQEIGREVGVPPEAVARAAAQLDQPMRAAAHVPTASTRSSFGMPIGVSRTLELPRRLTEAEWEQLVVDLRTTFDARGRLDVQGSFREWRNGRLRATLEPTATGERFRLQTLKESAQSMLAAGIGMWVISGSMLVLGALGIGDASLQGASVLAVAGAVLFGATAVQVKSWAQQRREQFDNVVSRLLATIQGTK